MNNIIWVAPWWQAAVKVTPTLPHVNIAIEQRLGSYLEWDYIEGIPMEMLQANLQDNKNSILSQYSQPNN